MIALRFQILIALAASTAGGCAAPRFVSHRYDSSVQNWFHAGAGQGHDGQLFDNRRMQTFIPHTSGKLLVVAFSAHRESPTTAPLLVRITETSNGNPTTVLGEVSIPANQFPTSTLKNPVPLNIRIDTRKQDIRLKAGREYGLLFGTQAPEANYRLYGVSPHNEDHDPYPQGILLRSQNSDAFAKTSCGDLLFELSMRPRFLSLPGERK